MLFSIQSNDNTIPAESQLRQWCDLVVQYSNDARYQMNSAILYKEQLKAAGFTDIVERKFQWPLNQWPKDQGLKELGKSVLFWFNWSL